MDENIFIDEYPIIDKAKDARRDFLADKKVLMYESQTGDTFSVNEQTLTKCCEKLQEGFEKLGEELRRIGYVTSNNLVKALNDAFGTERPNTIYGDKQGVVFLDEKAFDYVFTGSDGLIEKMEPTKPVYDISWVRKRMKCCKNPMERKQLEKQLNAAYKARKKARKNK